VRLALAALVLLVLAGCSSSPIGTPDAPVPLFISATVLAKSTDSTQKGAGLEFTNTQNRDLDVMASWTAHNQDGSSSAVQGGCQPNPLPPGGTARCKVYWQSNGPTSSLEMTTGGVMVRASL
jgi:hypothetical protein